MPSIPEKKNLTASAADVVNSIRSEVGGTFADQVPAAINEGQALSDGTIATREMALGTLRQIGDVITTYQPLANAFLSALVNRIGRVIINSKMYSNPWAGFKRGLLEYGETIEELFVNIVQAQDFDPETAENEVFKRKIPDVRSAFHTMNYQKFYKTTVSNDQLRQAFLSFEGISDLIGKITEALYTSANYDEYLVMKYMLCYAMEHGAFHPVTIAQPTATNSNSVVTTLKATSEKLQFLSADYNQAGVYNHTPKGDQYFIMTADFSSIVDVETLARAFNIDKVTLMGHTVIIDQFTFTTSETARLQELLGTQYTALTTSIFADVPCVCVDRDFFMIFDNFQNMTEQYNGEGLYWNYWLHQWKTFSTSPFANAVIFTDETPDVSAVAVNPSALTMGKGTSTQFTATVTNAGFASTGVTWSISGQQSANTRIDGQGRLYIAQDESATTITVTATSVFDTGKSNSATVTVSAS
nr:MAG TPA: Head protein [Caudoviricetes sp.]